MANTLEVGDRAATLGADGQWVRGVVEHLNGSLLLRVDHIGERPVTCEIREHFADGEWEDAVLPEAECPLVGRTRRERNPYQQQNDWFGLYTGDTSRDDVLFPKVRTQPERWDVWNDGTEKVSLRHGAQQWNVKPGHQVLMLNPGVGEALVLYAGQTELPVRLQRQQLSLLEVETEERLDPTTHPAKMSNALLDRIFAEMRGFGWLRDGDTVVDVFGGTGRTAVKWCALHPENRAATVEIEEHFIRMERQVKEYAESRLGRKLAWTIIHGDSRKSDALLAEAGVLVSSPPYSTEFARQHPGTAGGTQGTTPSMPGAFINYGNSPGQIEILPDPIDDAQVVSICSPPYEGTELTGERNFRSRFQPHEKSAAENPREGYGAVIASPPYEGSLASDDPEKRGGLFRDPKRAGDRTLTGTYVAGVSSPPYAGNVGQGVDHHAERMEGTPIERKYGESSAQIGNLPDRDAVGMQSPPYEDAINSQSHGIDWTKAGPATGNRKRGEGCKHEETLRAQLAYGRAGNTSPPYEDSINDRNGIDPEKLGRHGQNSQARLKGYQAFGVSSPPYEAQSGGSGEATREKLPDQGVTDRCGYKTDANGTAEGQIGTTQGETYASACRDVYAACARAGIRYLALVTKNPTRHGKLRRLERLTCRLLRDAGYRVVAWRRAWLWMSEAEVEALAGQQRMFQEEVQAGKRPKGRLSFFKRLQLKNGAVAAQWEDIIFAVLDEGRGDGDSVTSPPYPDAMSAGDGGAFSDRKAAWGGDAVGRMKADYARPTDPGNIGCLPDSSVAGIASPPYANTEIMHIPGSVGEAWAESGTPAIPSEFGNKRTRRYGFTEGQIGQMRDEEDPDGC